MIRLKEIVKKAIPKSFKPILTSLRYFTRKVRNGKRKRENFVREERYLIYNESCSSFEITKQDLNWSERMSLRRRIIKNLLEIHPTTSIHLKKINTTYYDNCLKRYLLERLDMGKSNEETCWFSLSQNNKCIGWEDPEEVFNLKKRKKFLTEIGKIKPSFNNLKLVEKLVRNDEGFIFLLSEKIFTKDDKVLPIFESVRRKGYIERLSSLSPIIIGFSRTTKRYAVIAGRHRIAALKYLAQKGIVEHNLSIQCHIVNYPFDSLVYTRPYKTLCKECIHIK